MLQRRIDHEASLLTLPELRRTRERARAGERDALSAHGHGVEDGRREVAAEGKRAALIGVVEKHTLAVGIGSRSRTVEAHILPVTRGHEVRHHTGRQLRTRHVEAQIEARIRTLVVALRGAVAAIVRILLETVDKVGVGGIVGGNARDAHDDAVLFVQQDHLLAPVADDVAPEGGALGVNGGVAIAADFGKLHLAPLEEVLHIDVVVAVAGLHDFTVGLVVPPDALAGVLVRVSADEVALGIIHLVVHGGPHFPAQAVSVDVDALAATDVADGREIPFLDELARAGIVEHLSQHIGGVLLYGKGLQPRTLGVDVARAEAVAVGDPRVEERLAVVVHGVAAHNHLVAAVTVHVAHTDLVEGRTAGGLVEELPETAGRAAAKVIGHTQIVVVVVASRAARVPLHHHRRVDAVQIADAHVAHVFVVFVAHQRGAVGAVVVLVVALLYRGLLASGHTVDDGDVAGGVARRLRLVVDDAVAVGVARGLALHIEAERLRIGIPELSTVRRLDDDVAHAVAVHIGDGDHVVLSGTAQLVGPQLHGPQMPARAQISLHVAVQGVGVRLAVDHIVHLAVAVEVHGPHIGGVESGGSQWGTSLFEDDVNEDVAHVVALHLVGHAHGRLRAVGSHHRHGHLCARGHLSRRRLPTGVRRRGHLRAVDIHVVGGLLRLLGQTPPRDGHFTVVVDGHHAAPQGLLNALRAHGQGQERHHCREKKSCCFHASVFEG